MEHIAAIAGLAALCALWFWIQRASGTLAKGGAGRCGMCGGDKSSCTKEGPECS